MGGDFAPLLIARVEQEFGLETIRRQAGMVPPIAIGGELAEDLTGKSRWDFPVCFQGELLLNSCTLLIQTSPESSQDSLHCHP